MDDVRWFSPNRYGALPVPALRRAGLAIALEGDESARLAVSMDLQCAVAGFEYARKHRCPLAFNIADLPPWRLGGGHPDLVFELAGRIRRIPRPIGRYPQRPGYYSRARFVARRASALWCPSYRSVEEVLNRFGCRAERVPFCYDSERFSRDRFAPVTGRSRPDEAPVVLSISRLVPHKNHSAVLRAAARLTPRPLVRIIGQGPEAGPLRRLAVELGVGLELNDTWVSDDDIVTAYQTATVVVCPSRFEGFGLTPMEAIALGIPAVVSDIPTHREFVDGLARFFPLDDDAALAAAIHAEILAPRGAVPERTAPTVSPLTDLTIDACAARLLPRLQRLLQGR